MNTELTKYVGQIFCEPTGFFLPMWADKECTTLTIYDSKAKMMFNPKDRGYIVDRILGKLSQNYLLGNYKASIICSKIKVGKASGLQTGEIFKLSDDDRIFIKTSAILPSNNGCFGGTILGNSAKLLAIPLDWSDLMTLDVRIEVE